MAAIVELWRYPLKSALGEPLRTAHVSLTGVAGDRQWACVDPADGTVGSAKHPRRWGRLLEVTARSLDDGGLAIQVGADVYEATGDASPRGVAGGRGDFGLRGDAGVRGDARAGGDAGPNGDAEAALAAHLGRPVRLTREVPPEARLHRTLPGVDGMVPDWMSGLRPGDDAVTDLGGAGAGGFVDFAPVHVVTTGELAKLGATPSRFRPNIVLDADNDPEPGAEIRLGDVVLRAMSPTPRCVIPGLDHGPGVPADTELLRTLARHYRVEVAGLGKAACFGVYAEVIQPGELRVGAASG
ncbi:MOSC domain-containing protein [Actinoplanes sp. CA-142083]|uniref:MOSC domain-containing protein n=1 Tax=Actinoplanes sp. CA-142083 TaxID=3239903 RepID=UPI003D89C43C